MIRFFILFATSFALAACSSVKREPLRQTPIAKAEVLPLMLDNDFSIRKVATFFHDPRDPNAVRPTQSQMINFERARKNFGAVNNYDRVERYGHYFDVWWRAKREADLTLRLEYRQQNTGSHVQAKEFFYPKAKGIVESKFTVIGDEYAEEGRITSWRILLIESGRIIGLRQSFLWN